MVPEPVEANGIVFGCALASSASSFAVFTVSSVRTTMTVVFLAASETPAKSVTGLYGMFSRMCGVIATAPTVVRNSV